MNLVSDATLPRLATRGLCRGFGGIAAVQDLSVSFAPGEVHAVVGENGAGKSTLMKLLAGLLQPDAGELLLHGQPVRLRSPHAALRRGIAMIHQEFLGFPDLTVAENVLIGCEPTRGFPGWIDRRRLRAQACACLERLQAPLAPDRRLRDLSVAERQAVEIARALAQRARVLILDEPTSALSEPEVKALLDLIRSLRRDGVTLVFISHRLEEVLALADRVTVLRDGRHVATAEARALTGPQLIRLMAGREVAVAGAQTRPVPGPVALEVRGLGRPPAFSDISFSVRQGEVVALAGLMGAGRTEVASAIYGLHPATRGEVRLFGSPVRLPNPQAALARGVAMVTEDRRASGLIPDASVGFNLTLSSLRELGRGPFLQPARETAVARGQIDRFGIKPRDPAPAVLRLSGGNQQKVLLARALLTRPRLLILDEPTRGIDVQAKSEVHAVIRQLAADGLAVLLVSSELPEVLSLSDRILVLRQGRLAGELDARSATPAEVLQLAMPAA
jgi:ABC-type sugar transport system ATPase subunit